MATYTTNLNLKKPATSDYVSIADINDNMDAIDTAIGNGAVVKTTASVAPSAATKNGFYYVSSSTNSLSGADANPFLQYHSGQNDFRILTTAYSDSWLQQIATDFRSDHVYIRRKENGTWQDWTELGGGGGATIVSNISVSSWSSDSTYTGFGYRAAIAITGVTASDVAEVVFGQTEASSGNYASVCETYAGGVYIYSSVNTSITIPTILIHKG